MESSPCRHCLFPAADHRRHLDVARISAQGPTPRRPRAARLAAAVYARSTLGADRPGAVGRPKSKEAEAFRPRRQE